MISASAALVVGTLGGYKVNAALEEARYPLAVEYAIVDSCVNSSSNMVSVSWYTNKRKTCLCALEKTEEKISYSDYKADQRSFLTSFKLHALACS